MTKQDKCSRGHDMSIHRVGKDGETCCRKCKVKAAQDWKNRNPERRREYVRRTQIKLNYGITFREYNDLAVAQGGVCVICGGMTPGKRLSVDHDHKTGKVRGLLCDLCNRGLGMFKDSSAILRKASEYLDDHACDTIALGKPRKD